MRNEGGRKNGKCSEYAWDRGDERPFVFVFKFFLPLPCIKSISFSAYSSTSPNIWAGVSGKGNRFNTSSRHGPKHIQIICHLPGPPTFSLVPTFEMSHRLNQWRIFEGELNFLEAAA
jgi:hypothetical protein